MKITSAQFIKGLVEADDILEDGKPQVAFIGRSNVGKSSAINALTKQKGLARTSSFPGRTQEINIFLINKSFYLVDLPGYGFVKSSVQAKQRLQDLIYWYLFDSPYKQKKVVLIIDAYVGPTSNDLAMLHDLEEAEKDIIILANKVDKIKKSQCANEIRRLQELFGGHIVIPYSSEKNIGINDLAREMLK